MMLERMCIVLVAFCLDLIFGDPRWLPHPIVYIGKCISSVKKGLKSLLKWQDDREADVKKKLFAGAILVVTTLLVCTLVPMAVLAVANYVRPYFRIGIEIFWTYQLLAAKSLYIESMKVKTALDTEGLEAGRYAVSMIVGRDTDELTTEGVIKACVETIAENASDGVVAPLCFYAVFGLPGMFFYKACNTMDSMVGYKNDVYLYLGRCAAKLDDVVNYIPARLSGVLMVISAFYWQLIDHDLSHMDGKHAWEIFKRDRYKHASPNSAQTESAVAGALHVQLAGNAIYFGKEYQKETLGNRDREIEVRDIVKTNQLMLTASVLALIVCEAVLAVASVL